MQVVFNVFLWSNRWFREIVCRFYQILGNHVEGNWWHIGSDALNGWKCDPIQLLFWRRLFKVLNLRDPAVKWMSEKILFRVDCNNEKRSIFFVDNLVIDNSNLNFKESRCNHRPMNPPVFLLSAVGWQIGSKTYVEKLYEVGSSWPFRVNLFHEFFW